MSKQHLWKPGQSGNPQGGRLHNQDIKKLRSLGLEQISDLGRLVLTNSYDEIGIIAHNKNNSVLKIWMARVILKGIADGDVYILNTFLPWIVGKIPDKIEHKYELVVEHLKNIESLSDDDLIAQLEQTIEAIKAEKAVIPL